MNTQITLDAWLATNTKRLDIANGFRLPFNAHALADYQDLLDYVCEHANHGVVLPAVYTFKQKFELHTSTPATIRAALEMTIAAAGTLLHFTDLNRLELAAMLLSPTNLERSGCAYYSFVEQALSSSPPASFRSARLYSRSLLADFNVRGTAVYADILAHAQDSERILYALVDLDQDGDGDACYKWDINQTMEEAFEQYYRSWPVYLAVKALHSNPVERINAMTEVMRRHPTSKVTLPRTLLG